MYYFLGTHPLISYKKAIVDVNVSHKIIIFHNMACVVLVGGYIYDTVHPQVDLLYP